MSDRTAPPPPATDPRPGRNRGYAEPQPRDAGEARQRHPAPPCNPDEGGMTRDPDADPAPGDDAAG